MQERNVTLANDDNLSEGGKPYPVRIEFLPDGWAILFQPPLMVSPRTSDDHITLTPGSLRELQRLLNELHPELPNPFNKHVAIDADVRKKIIDEFVLRVTAHLAAEDKRLDGELARWDAAIKANTEKTDQLVRQRGQDYDRQYEVRRMLCKVDQVKEEILSDA